MVELNISCRQARLTSVLEQNPTLPLRISVASMISKFVSRETVIGKASRKKAVDFLPWVW